MDPIKHSPEFNIVRDMSILAPEVKLSMMVNDLTINVRIQRQPLFDFNPIDEDVVLSLSMIWFRNEEIEELFNSNQKAIIRENLFGVVLDCKIASMPVRESILETGIMRETTAEDLITVKEMFFEKGVHIIDFIPTTKTSFNLVLDIVNPNKRRLDATWLSMPLFGKKSLEEIRNFMTDEKFEALSSMSSMVMDMAKGKKKVKRNISLLVEESISDITSLRTLVSRIKDRVTARDLDIFYRMRHECLNSEVRRVLNLQVGASDVNLVEIFNYNGVDCYKTPDMVYVDEAQNCTYLLDVAVTSMPVHEIYGNKLKKYRIAARGIEAKTGMDTDVEAVVMSSSQSGNFHIPGFMRENREEMEELQKSIIDITKEVESKTGFARANEIFKSTQDEKEFSEKEGIMKNLLDAYFSISTLKEKKSSSLQDSFTMGPNDMDVNYTDIKNDDVIQRIKEDYNKFDSTKVKREIMTSLFSKLQKDEVPVSLEKVLNHQDYTQIAKDLVDKATSIRKDVVLKDSFKIPKVFKFPDMTDYLSNEPMYAADTVGKWKGALEDGTIKLMMWSDPPESTKEENRKGIGLDVRDDYESMMNLSTQMSEESSQKFQEEMERYLKLGTDTASVTLRRMMKLKIMELTYAVEKLARNIIYMEGRRMENGSKFCVFKAFKEEGYSLVIHRGSRLTKEAQIRYKLYSVHGNSDNEYFHAIHDTGKGFSETSWLTMSQVDLQTFSCIFEKMVSLMSHYYDCYMEGNPSSLLTIDKLMREDYFMIPAFILLEQKRGTSTTCQYNRYILNSMTGYKSNKEKMMNDIMSDPVRSRLEAFVRCKQIDWSTKLFSGHSSYIVEAIKNKMSTSTDYDRFECPSIFSGETKMEFTFLMNDIYLGNLFQKDAGFTGHRSKAVIQKQTIEEIHYLKVRDKETLNSDVTIDDCFSKKDENHQYDKRFVMLAAHELGEKLRANPKYTSSILKVMTDNLHDAMMMTSSLKECKVKTRTLLNNAKKVNLTSHETLKDLIDEHGTSSMVGIISRELCIEAIFSMFAKAQIGGPREILIQSYKLRAHMKFFETLCEEFCKMLDKEMLTGSREKEMRQSSTSTEFKRKVINEKVKRSRYGLTPTIVADASRWSPSFTMTMFCHFLVALGLPEDITDHGLILIKSFSAKLMHLPESLCDKWKRKPVAEKEEDESLEWLRTHTDSVTRVQRLMSGMGQGMFHRFSSLIHVAKDDITDQIIKTFLTKSGVEYDSRTMISSDDMMKQMVLTSSSMKEILVGIDKMLIIYEVTNRLCNIHINWKKTALSFIIDEFNSYFTVGNRACLAVIKDIFTAMEPVDMTEPLTAVSEVLQNISRAMRNGAYLTTVEIMFKVMRAWIIRSYAIEDSTIEALKSILDCSEEDLPMDLGFLSCKHIVGQVIFGNQILMYESGNSKNLADFYKGTYTCLKEEVAENMNEDYMISLSGKVKLCLPFRTDKKMKEMVNSYHAKHGISVEDVMREEEDTSLMLDHSRLSWLKHRLFSRSYFIGKGRRYEFGESLKTHTMVRALQYRRMTLKTRPDFDPDTRWDVLSFARRMITRASMNSGMRITACYEKMMGKVEESETYYKSCSLSSSVRHTRKRKVMFRTREVVMRADPEEVFSVLTKKKINVSNRLQVVISDICELLEIPFADFKENPLKAVLNSMKSFKYPLVTFKLLLKDYIENRLDFGTDMMIADVDQGNVVDNLLMVYRDKKDPRAPLHTVKSNNMMIIREAVSTMMSVGRSIEPMTFQTMGTSEEVYDEVKKIHLSDRSIDKAVKLITAHSQGIPVDSDFIFHSVARKNRVGRKSEGLMEISHLYSTVTETWVMNVDPIRKEVVYEVYSCSDIIVVNSQMAKLMDEDLRKESASDFPRFYWRNGKKTVHPVAPMSEYILEPHIESSHSTWNTWLLLTIDSGHSYKGIKEVDIMVSKDKYYIYGEMLMKISDTFKDDDFYTKFHEFIGIDMDISILQDFVSENDMCVENPLEPIGSRSAMMVSLEEEVKAYSKEFMMQSMLDAFGADDDDEDDTDFGSMFKAMEVTQPKDAMGEMVMDFSTISGWSDILEAAQNAVGSERLMDVPKSERLHMTELLTRNVSSVISKEFKIRFSDIREAFRREKDPKSSRAKSVWCIIATVIDKNEKVKCSWLTRMALVYIYSRISTRHGIPVPTEVNILSGLKTELVSLVQERVTIEDAFDSVMNDYFGSD